MIVNETSQQFLNARPCQNGLEIATQCSLGNGRGLPLGDEVEKKLTMCSRLASNIENKQKQTKTRKEYDSDNIDVACQCKKSYGQQKNKKKVKLNGCKRVQKKYTGDFKVSQEEHTDPSNVQVRTDKRRKKRKEK